MAIFFQFHMIFSVSIKLFICCTDVTLILSKAANADSLAPDQPAHLHSLILELHCPLTCKKRGPIDLSADSVALRSDCNCTGLPGATLSAYNILTGMFRVKATYS